MFPTFKYAWKTVISNPSNCTKRWTIFPKHSERYAISIDKESQFEEMSVHGGKGGVWGNERKKKDIFFMSLQSGMQDREHKFRPVLLGTGEVSEITHFAVCSSTRKSFERKASKCVSRTHKIVHPPPKKGRIESPNLPQKPQPFV